MADVRCTIEGICVRIAKYILMYFTEELILSDLMPCLLYMCL